MTNRYTKALKHIKNKNIDEKLKLLEQIPTNNTGGLYLDIPGEVITPPPEQVLPRAADLAEDGDGAEGYTGNDTTGLFLDDGTILIEEPPGDTSYILGPMISMWYAWANYTQIGYVRQSDRKMVNLGRITGEMSAWDGETGFTGYGQLSIEQAVWYKGQTRADYRAFYPGPPSNEPDQYGRYIGSIVSVAKPTTRNPPPYKGDDTNRGFDATDDHSLAMDNLGGWLAAAAVLGFVGKTALDFYQWWNRQNEEMKQKLRDLVNPPEYSKEIQYQNVAGLRPDGTQGANRLGDINRGHDGTLYRLQKRTLPDGTPAGYNIWSPVRQAGGGGNNMFAHHEPKGLVLTESRKKILRDIKKPIEVKEIPTKFKVKPTGRKNKSVGVDMMKIPDVPKQYKPQMNIWGKADYNANVRASQEKKNEVLELVGAAEHHWTYLTEDRRKKHQEKVNEMMSVEYDKQMELLYEKHRIKENKLNKAISAFKKPTDIAPEYPKEPPPQLDPQTGMHPKFGKNYKHDKLDPQSAESMPSTGNPEIDANVKKATNAKEKSRKLKVLLGNRKKISESMTTASLMSTTLPAEGDADLVNVDVSNADTWFGGSNSGTVSASGLSFDQLPSQGDSFTNWSFSNLTSAFDATAVNNLKVTVTTGTGVDAPKSGNPLKVEWFNGTELGLLGTFSAGGGTQVFELPKEANVKDLRIFYSVSSDGTDPYSTYTNEYLVGKSVFGGTMNSTDSSGAMSMLRMGNPPSPSPPNYPTSESVKLLFGGVWWVDALSNGNPRGYQAPSGNPIVDQDRLAIWNQVFSLYGSFANRGSNLYTIASTNFQRRTPMNVFVSLDSPEATAFIRTDPSMQGLSAEERRKKLIAMLDAGDEYLLKYLGLIGSKARPSEVIMPPSWDQAAQNSSMDIQVGDERITKVDGKTKTDTTRGIKDGKIDGKDFNTQPKSQPQFQPQSQPDSEKETSISKEKAVKNIFEPISNVNNSDKAELEKNIEASLKQLEIDNEQLKGDSLKRNITTAVELGLDVLTVASILATGDGSGALALAASKAGVKAGVKKGVTTGVKTAVQTSTKTAAQRTTIDAFQKQVTSPKTLDAASQAIKRAGPKYAKDVAIPIKVQGKTINIKANEILRNKGIQANSYKPKGETIMEKNKKSFKDLTKKIPGYYDGKPAPLGFPMQEPPKMKNGFHPDLVDGKKVANRFNRLDPQSAKAMPPTGNPHIDKKVRAAAKKPK